MKDRIDTSMGIVTLIAEALVKIDPTEPLRFTKRQIAGNETDQIQESSVNSPVKTLESRWTYKKNKRKKSSYTRGAH